MAPRCANGGAGPLSDPLGRSRGTAFIVCNIAAFRARCRSMHGSDHVWCAIFWLKGAMSLVNRSESCVGGQGGCVGGREVASVGRKVVDQACVYWLQAIGYGGADLTK